MASSTREVVTLQIGHYANFVGTHWWNIQESSFVYQPSDATYPKEVNHDVLFREGQNLQGDVTYTPRLVAFDLKGSLNSLRQEGVLYDLPDPQDDLQWNNDITLHKSTSVHKNEFLRDLEKQEATYLGREEVADEEGEQEADMEQEVSMTDNQVSESRVFGTRLYNLDDQVQVWSDYLRPHLHPKSIYLLEKYHRNNDLESFDLFGYGRSISNHAEKDEIEDRLHFFLEECDQLQGLHILADTYDGFGGLASRLVEHIEDDYSSKGISVFGVSPPVFENSTATQDSYRLLNTVFSYNALTSHSALFLPLSTSSTLWRRPGPPTLFPHLSYKGEAAYHNSAILAASLDTLTMPYRLETNASMMTHLTGALTPGGRKVVGLQTALPFPLVQNNNLIKSLMQLGDELPWQPLTPLLAKDVPAVAQSVVLRGIPSNSVVHGPDPDLTGLLSSCTTVDEVLEVYLRDLCPNSLSAGCVLRSPCKVTAPYPHIFQGHINSEGHISNTNRLDTQGVESVPMMTSLQCTPAVGGMLANLHAQASKLNIKRFHRVLETGLELDEYTEIMNSLQTLAHNHDNRVDDMH